MKSDDEARHVDPTPHERPRPFPRSRPRGALKLSDLRPCDRCGGPLELVFHVVRSSLAIVMPDRAQGVLGLGMTFGGIRRPGALAVAEALAPDVDAVVFAGDQEGASWTELFLCSSCWAHPETQVAAVAEGLEDRRKAARETQP